MPNPDDFDIDPFRDALGDADSQWVDNFVRRDPAVDPEQLLAHPANARIHATRQQKAMHAILARLGWVRDVLVNQRTGRIVDGHLRVLTAMKHNQRVPVTYIDVTEKQEKELLAVLDAVTSMAVVDADMYQDLIDDFEAPGDAIANMFADVSTWKVPTDLGPTNEDETSDDLLGDIVYGMVGWSETKVKASGEEIASLTALHMEYRADNGGTDEGFVQWLIQSHLA